MNSDLRTILASFSNKTVELINCVKEEKFDELEPLLAERDKYIEEMKKLQYKKEEFEELCKELDIVTKQKLLTELTSEKRKDARNSLEKLKVSKDANKNYNKNFHVDSLFFNKKI